MSKLFETFVAAKAAMLALTSRRALSYPGAERALGSVGAWKKFVRIHSGACSETVAKATIRLWNRHCGKSLPDHEVAMTINNVKAKAEWKKATQISNVARGWNQLRISTCAKLLETAETVYSGAMKSLFHEAWYMLKKLQLVSWCLTKNAYYTANHISKLIDKFGGRK